MKTAVIIPSYKVKDHILDTISAIGPETTAIYVVDDKCPDGSGAFVEAHCDDPRVSVVYNAENRGVGGAVMTGYRHAIDDGMDILVKIDGDGQMDPRLIPTFTRPIEDGHADYTKGNRFFASESLEDMPFIRLLGNAVLSFMTKASSGYWDLLDPTNGYTAIHAKVAAVMNFDKISERYFFESDLLFHLSKIRARVMDIPLMSLYGDEVSNLKVRTVLPTFFKSNLKNTIKRIAYNYFVRGFSMASVALTGAFFLLIPGLILAAYVAIHANVTGQPTSVGGVLVIAIMLIFGFQLLLMFLSADIASTPQTALHPRLSVHPQKPLLQSYPGKTVPVQNHLKDSVHKTR